MVRRIAVVVLLVPVLGLAVARAQSSESAPAYLDRVAGIGLNDAITRARQQEPGLRAVRADVDVARGQHQQSGLRANPSTTLEARHEPGGTDSLFSIGIEWPLELFRRPGRVATAEQLVAASQLIVADRERMLIADVRTQYGRAAAAIREAEVASELTRTVARQLELSRARAQEGGAPQLEADLLEVELRRLEATRDLAQGRADRAMVALKPLLGMRADEPLRLREPLAVLVSTHAMTPAAGGQPPSPDQRTDVRVAAQQVAVADARLAQVSREGRFDVSLFGSYMRMDSGFPQLGLSASGVPERIRDQFHYVSGGAIVMLPLLNRNQGAVASAQAERAGAEKRREAAALAASAEVAAARARQRRAAQALAAYGETTRTLARRNLDVVRQTYELGRATVFDVMAEQRRYLEFEQGYTATLLEAWEARADLGRALGDDK